MDESVLKELEPIKSLGIGGFGKVYKYGNQDSDFWCAGKHQDCNSRARQEASFLKNINNPHIIKYFGEIIKELHGVQRFIIFMELADMSLDTYIYNVGAVKDPVKFRSIACQLVEGLYVLHEKKIIHRDLSYQNILVKGNVFKLADFGSATLFEDNNFASVGHSYTQSPEMILGYDYDQSVDVWGLGCCLYFIATNERPFGPYTGTYSILLHINLEIGFPEKFHELVVANLGWRESVKLPFLTLLDTIGSSNWHLICSCLKTDPEERLNAAQLYNHPTFFEDLNPNAIPYAFNKRYFNIPEDLKVRAEERFRKSIY